MRMPEPGGEHMEDAPIRIQHTAGREPGKTGLAEALHERNQGYQDRSPITT